MIPYKLSMKQMLANVLSAGPTLTVSMLILLLSKAQ